MYIKLLFELHPTLLEQRFLSTDIGKMYQAIPWQVLAQLVQVSAHQQRGLGRKPWLDVKGGIGLMFLKHYLQLSKVNTRNQVSETCWIFFGIHTANAFNIGKRIAAKTKSNPPPQKELRLAA